MALREACPALNQDQADQVGENQDQNDHHLHPLADDHGRALLSYEPVKRLTPGGTLVRVVFASLS